MMTRDAASAPGAKLWNRRFFLLWQGQAVSQLGNQAFSIAMLYWTLKATGSASLMGTLLAATALPAVLLSPIGGTLADRWPRLRVILVADLLSGGCLAALAVIMFASGSPRLVVPLLAAVALALAAIRAFFNPALLAAVPDLVSADRLPAANAANQFAWQAAMFVGQGLGGVGYAIFGAPLLFAADAASFLLSAGCTALIGANSGRRAAVAAPGQGEGTTARGELRRFGRELREGLRYTRATPGLLPLLLAASSFNFFLMPIVVLLPIYLERYLHCGPEWYGFTLAAVGIGSLLGFVATGAVRLAPRARLRAVAWLMQLTPLCLLAIGFVRVRAGVLAVSVLLGLMLAVTNVEVLSIVQATTPLRLRGRVLGLLTLLASGLSPLGMAIGGVAGDLSHKNVSLVFGLCGGCALALQLLLVRRRSVYAFLARAGGDRSDGDTMAEWR